MRFCKHLFTFFNIFRLLACPFLCPSVSNQEKSHNETANPSKPPDCDDLAGDNSNKEEFQNEATNPSKLPDCDVLVSDHANKEEFHNKAINPSKSPDCETAYDSVSGLANKEFHNDHLKPPGYETIYNLDIEYSELADLKPFESGGFGTVYKGQWNGLCIAAKFVKRGGFSTELKNKDFERELEALRTSKYCKEYIIQFYGLSQ
ncbi:20692_t:CDS:2, partial [Dentiscutata erythropus]